MSDKPREFWLDLDGAWYGFEEKIPDAIHVIEKSAYDEFMDTIN